MRGAVAHLVEHSTGDSVLFPMEFRCFFSNFEKKTQSSKKKFFFEDWDFHSVTTHKLHGDNLLALHLISSSIVLMAKVCVIAHLFLLTKNNIIKHYNKFTNLWVYHANFPNLKDARAPYQN